MKNRTRVDSSVIGIDDITLSNTKAVNLSKCKTFLKLTALF
ncbi:hypothetical protein P1059_01634 [Pasteurella multocida subsp. gallicida P1059]|nr:hypothetical protein P1059_01634 [Pasteurella multocida subsp. gallicida P1059]